MSNTPERLAHACTWAHPAGAASAAAESADVNFHRGVMKLGQVDPLPWPSAAWACCPARKYWPRTTAAPSRWTKWWSRPARSRSASRTCRSRSRCSATSASRAGVARVEDVAKLVPGVTFDVGAFPNDTRPAIRGMVAERGRPSVAVLLDGQGPRRREPLHRRRFLVAEHLTARPSASEVVKGPQSVLYGRAAFAGTCDQLHQQAPGPGAMERQGRRRGLERRDARPDCPFTGPVVRDRLAIRVNLNSFKRDGF